MKLIKFSNQLFCIHAGSHRDGFKIPSLTKNVYVQTLRFEQQQKMGQFSPDYCQQLTVCQCLFVILPVFLWFSAHSERYWAVWQTGQQLWTCTKPQKDNKITIACLFARLTPVFFPKKAPVFRPSFYKNEPVWTCRTPFHRSILWLLFLKPSPTSIKTSEYQLCWCKLFYDSH